MRARCCTYINVEGGCSSLQSLFTDGWYGDDYDCGWSALQFPKSMYIYIYIIVMWFSMFVCSHPGPGEVDDVIDWCGRCWIAAVLEEEIGMGEKRHCYYL